MEVCAKGARWKCVLLREVQVCAKGRGPRCKCVRREVEVCAKGGGSVC